MIKDCCCWLVDELLDRSASRSIIIDEGEPAMSTALSATATGTGETTLCEGLKYSSNIGCDLLALVELLNHVEYS
ncbi:hypothetical protein Tco_0303616 [Tanacetum coccineum]